jgi:hypothetical protein
LQTGVSASALPLALHGLLSREAAAEPGVMAHVALATAIFDARYTESRLFAASLDGLGVRTQALRDGDVTDAYLTFDRLWRHQPTAIAGLTQFGPMFVLEQLGRERGLRVALRVAHEVRVDGTLAHTLTGAPDTLALAETLRQQDVEWPVLIAALVAHCRGDCSAPVERTIATTGGRPSLMERPTDSGSTGESDSVIHYYRQFAIQEGRGIPWDGPLFSWVLAPGAPA